jgi:hypothetical protein
MAALEEGPALRATSTFRRADDHLTLIREHHENGPHLLIIENGEGRARTFTFADDEKLAVFQNDMEHFLVHTGWSLVAFAPDRRTTGDRRCFPRIDPDRRRWWTDVHSREES